MEDELDADFFRRRLLELRAELQRFAGTGEQAAQPVELDQTRVGRLSRMDAMQAQAMSQAAERRRQARLGAIQRALVRLDRDQYGECCDCGELIAPRRLEFDPTAERCIGCASKAER